MKNMSIGSVLKKNAMLIVLVLVYVLFLFLTKGAIFSPANFSELINQNTYVYILGTGMLTFGNIFTFLQINGEAIKLPILKAVDGSYDFSISLFSNPAGGFIVFGIIMAIIAAVENHKKELARQKALEEKKKQAAMKAQAAAGGEQK